MTKVDVCLNFYGKPYQTVVTLLSLWKYSRQHIGKIYIITEKEQPHGQHAGPSLLRYYLKDLPIIYYTPKYFYEGVGSPPAETMSDVDRRYSLSFQYALENSNAAHVMLTHNDCLYKEDLLGIMLSRLEENKTGDRIAGVGLIGQCWNCPAFFAKVCDSERMQSYVPDAEELSQLVRDYPPSRLTIHQDLIKAGKIHPLPECRLNEYACLIDTVAYKKEVMPAGNVFPFGGNWDGTDTGASWFYSMYNLGYRFINQPFEPHMIHAPFVSHGSGHSGNSNSQLYFNSENMAREYLLTNGLIAKNLPVSVTLKSSLQTSKGMLIAAIRQARVLLGRLT